MSKKNWPDHPGIGKKMKMGDEDVTVVDVKCGPMLLDTSTMDQPHATIHGTLKLKVRYEGGAEVWTAPIDDNSFLAWCDKQVETP